MIDPPAFNINTGDDDVSADKITCDNCSAELAHCQLDETTATATDTDIITTTTQMVCPHCRAVLRTVESTQTRNTAAVVAQDLEAIEEWLSDEHKNLPGLMQPAARETSSHVWQLRGILPAGAVDNWTVEARYNERDPRSLAVRIVAIEPGHVRDAIEPLASVFAEHGLQPHGEQTTRVGIDENPDEFFARLASHPHGEPLPEVETGPVLSTRWGAEQILSTRGLVPGLLRGVVARLVRAMRDATHTRNRAAT